MPGFRPRLGVVACGGAAAVRSALQALAGGLGQAAEDLVLLAGEGALPPQVPGARVHTPRELREALERERAAGRGAVHLLLAPGPDALLEGRRLASEGWLDGLLLAGEPGGAGPRLRARDGVRVVEPFPGETLRGLLLALDPVRIAALCREAGELLALMGPRRPRLVLLDLAGESAPAEAARLLRDEGLDLEGPLEAGAAARERADALVALDGSQGELLLALLGRGPETRFALGRGDAARAPEAWSARPEEAGLLLAAARLGELARARGPLAAEREAARAPVLSVRPTARPPGTPAQPAPPQDRCPYCHRALDDPPGDATGDPPGAPVVCAGCKTAHHRDCLADHGRCTVLGCAGTAAERLGVSIPFARLGASHARVEPFRPLTGDTGAGPGWLRIEAPHDEPERAPRARRLRLELPRRELRPGEVLQGFVTLEAPRPLRVRGGVVRVRAELTTREPPDAERVQAIVHREATLVGETPAGALGRLQDGVASLFGSQSGVPIPAGVRRWPIALRLHPDHPPTVQNRSGRAEESVATVLEAVIDGEQVAVPVLVRR